MRWMEEPSCSPERLEEIFKRFRVAIYIPAYNAAQTLPSVLDRIPLEVKAAVKEILVVDNASPDNTHLVAMRYRAQKGLDKLCVIRNPRNLGYGGSQKVAYRYAIRKGYDLVVLLHGDAQYAPEKIPDLLEPFAEHDPPGVVLGSRMLGDPLGGGMPLQRYLGNRFLTWIQNKVLGLDLSEYHSGFRVYRVAAIAQVPFERCADYYDFDADIPIQFVLKGIKIAERPIPTYYGTERSYVNVIKYGLLVLRSLAEYILHVRGIRRVAKFDVGARAVD